LDEEKEAFEAFYVGDIAKALFVCSAINHFDQEG
jgi:hypothetical protein